MQHKPIYIFLFFCLNTALFAQQDEQYTQFMFNKLRYNPAYAGTQESPSITAIARKQWIGLDGAPQSQALTFDLPLLNNRVGVGGNIYRNTVAVTEKITFDGSYSYRVPLGTGIMGMGIQASLRFMSVDFSRLEGTQPISIDGAIPANYQSKFVPNFGLGFYYHTQQFYLGFSLPRFLKTNIDLADDDGVISREVQHYYLMSGMMFGDGDFKFLPQFLVKYTQSAPLDADVNLSFIFLDKITIGGTYRIGGARANPIGSSASGLFSMQVNDNILLGLSYDVTLTELRNYQDGSVELILRYHFGEGKSKIVPNREYINPRHF